MFERFTDRARRVLVLAQEEARLLDHGFIGTEHILLGLLREHDGVAARALATLEISPEAAANVVKEMVGSGSVSPIGSPPFTPRAKKVLELSLREALELRHNYIGTEHILLGLIREGEGVAAQVLVHFVGNLIRVRQAVIILLAGSSGSSASQGDEPGERGEMPARGWPARGWPARGWAARSSGGTGARIVWCSFCGRRPPHTGQLVSSADAFICEHCIRHWASALPATGSFQRIEGVQRIEGDRIDVSSVDVAGPPPDDEDGARAEIASAYAAIATASEDGESVPSVERGDDLGPALRRARDRRPPLISPQYGVDVGPIVFVDHEHAAVWFTITVDGRPSPVNRRGEAVLVDGSWKMARSTFCELMALAGVDCPPDPEG